MSDFIEIQPMEVNRTTIQALNELESGLRDDALAKAVYAAASPIAKIMKATAPDNPATPQSRLALAVNTTKIKNGAGMRTGAGRRTVNLKRGEMAVVVGPNRKTVKIGGEKNKIIGAPQLAMLLEHGTKAHKIGSVFRRNKIGDNWVRGPIKHPGIRPRNWMANSMTAGQSQMSSKFFERIERFIERGK